MPGSWSNGGGKTASEIAVNSAGFNGNLAPTDDTVQKALQKFDDVAIGAGGAPSGAAGGALGGTYPNPTFAVDMATQAELDAHNTALVAHGLTIANVETTSGATTKVTNHNNATTSVHGIADTSALETSTGSALKVTNHNATTTSVHGIADTSVLATNSSVASAVAGHTSDTLAAHAASAISVDASGFNGNLTTLDTDMQAVAQKLDDLTAAGSSYHPPYLVVASQDADATTKASADYVCSGTADQVEIQAAIDAATSAHAATDVFDPTPFPYGTVMLTGGQFDITSAILLKTGVHLTGQGALTELIADGNTATGTGMNGATAGARAAVLKLYDRYTHYVQVSNMTLNGDYASGGACDAIYFASLSGNNADMDGWPSSNPDPNIHIHDIIVRNFKGTGSRKSILIADDCRGTIIDRCQVKLGDVSGIEFYNAPDSHVSNVHLGDFNSYGYDVSTSGNIKFTNCKAFYCDVAGFRLGGRSVAAGCEAQDNEIGFLISSQPSILSGCIVDTNNTGISTSANSTMIMGAQIFNRGNGRYNPCLEGMEFVGTLTDCMIIADVQPTSGTITTPIVNGAAQTAANRNFIKITTETGSTLGLTVG